MSIRTATLNDLDRLMKLEERSFISDRFTRAQYKHLLTKAHATIYVIDQLEQILGAAVLLWRKGSSTAKLYSFMIDPAFQGRGLGGQLIDRCVTECQKRGCRTLALEVRMDNLKAIKLYERHGFIRQSLLANFYADGTDGYEMRRPISS